MVLKGTGWQVWMQWRVWTFWEQRRGKGPLAVWVGPPSLWNIPQGQPWLWAGLRVG